MLTIMTVSPLSAQTELTTDMIWQEGTHWVYPYKIHTDMYGHKTGIYLRECKLVKFYSDVSDDSDAVYLSPMSRTNYKGAWYDDWEYDGVDIKVTGNKVYGLILTNGYDLTDGYSSYLMYDFDTWDSGGTIRFEEYGFNDEVNATSVILGDSECVTTDPEKKYYAYAFSGVDKNNNSTYYIKNIGRTQDQVIANLIYYYIPYSSFWEAFGQPDGIQALKIWHPDLGVLYQHPEYDRYMELTSGIESVEADEAQGEPVITAADGTVTIATDDITQVTVCTPTGAVVRQETIAGTVSYPLAPGIYIVRAGAVTRKVRV